MNATPAFLLPLPPGEGWGEGAPLRKGSATAPATSAPPLLLPRLRSGAACADRQHLQPHQMPQSPKQPLNLSFRLGSRGPAAMNGRPKQRVGNRLATASNGAARS